MTEIYPYKLKFCNSITEYLRKAVEGNCTIKSGSLLLIKEFIFSNLYRTIACLIEGEMLFSQIETPVSLCEIMISFATRFIFP